MISTLTIEGFRCFERLEMGGLGRVNLIVGKNNSGKTSLLEALYLLAMRGKASAFGMVLQRRGEILPIDSELGEVGQGVEYDVRPLFTGHRFGLGTHFEVTAANSHGSNVIGVTVGKDAQIVPDQTKTTRFVQFFALLVNAGGPNEVIPLGYRDGLPADSVRPRLITSQDEGAPQVRFLGPYEAGRQLIEMWDGVALTDDEAIVGDALRVLDPTIERIAPQVASSHQFGSTRGGFLVKKSGNTQRLSIGSFGDGIWRLLALSVFLTQAKGGLLLVDEIDLGLHYKAMTSMWKLVLRIAKEADVQVFATTHSRDCVQSLADVLDAGETPGSVSLQRLEAGKQKAITFTETQIRLLADDWVETR